MNKILITGSKGQLGTEIIKQVNHRTNQNLSFFALDIDELDITNEQTVSECINIFQPSIIINCAAYTNVDGCEVNEDLAYKVNAIGPKNLAVAAEEIDCKLIHISTDYVFSGEDNGKIPHTEDEKAYPISAYGRTKLAGEEFVKQYCSKYFIVRTAWLYGYYSKNFVKTIVNAGKKYGKLEVVNDQLGNPTNAVDLASEVIKLMFTDKYGIYHCTGNGICSWYEFARKIIEYSGIDAEVYPCSTEEYKKKHPLSADRPKWPALDNKHLRETIGDDMRYWEDALQDFFMNWKGDRDGGHLNVSKQNCLVSL